MIHYAAIKPVFEPTKDKFDKPEAAGKFAPQVL